MKNTYIILLFTLAFISCKTNSSKEEHSHEHGEEQIVSITHEQMLSAGIDTGTVQLKNIAGTVRANGQLALPPQNEAEINSLIAGRISEISVQAGYSVKKGQVVAYIENLDIIQMQENYLSLKKEIVFSEQEYNRQKELYQNKATSEKIFQQVSATYSADKARLSGLEIRLKQLGIDTKKVAEGDFSSRIPIVAPIGGVIGKVFVKTGSYVEVQTPLMELADHSSMHCDLNVYEKDFAFVRQGQNVHLHITNSDEEIHGKVYRINRSFENESKSITVHVAIDRQDKVMLIPGMYVSAEIEVENALVPAVPESAVVRSEGKEFIFVETTEDTHGHENENKAEHAHAESGCSENAHENENEAEHAHADGESLCGEHATKFRKVEVVTGNRQDGYVAITSANLEPDTHIVVKGAIYLLSSTLGEPSHEH
ncbi:MAG: efflux RND transporter periplasmic adaptor subunit [Bacteroidales bacterium]|jgi:cobalt-zinc-cadmium efflux system membrane fusion protein|nr:efflux RND transporter periplasmic adaptor subunit [Bacteroidales bacterium]